MSNTKLIEEAFQAFENIGNTTSRLAKESFVEGQAKNPLFNEMVMLAYNPFKMFYVKKFKVPQAEETRSLPLNYATFIELTNRLSQRTLSGNAAQAEIENVFKAMSEVEQKWYARILQKDLKIGMTSGTFNRVHEALGTSFVIPTFSCALAQTYQTKKIPKNYAVEPKLDGYRCLAFRYPEHVELRSRNGKPIEGYASIEAAIRNFPEGYVYDGEIMGVSGQFSEMQQYAARKDMEDKPGIFHLFDMIPIAEFEGTAETRMSFLNRRQNLEETFYRVNAKTMPVIDIVSIGVFGGSEPYKEGMTGAEAIAEAEATIMKIHQEFLSEGYEGSMVKDIHGYYEMKRSWNIQKVKDFDNLDLTVIGVEQGKEGTQFENTLGALIVDYKGNSVWVGSGFTPEQRDEIWRNKEDIINRVVEVKYFEETKNKKGEVSLRFPIFIQFRHDKE